MLEKLIESCLLWEGLHCAAMKDFSPVAAGEAMGDELTETPTLLSPCATGGGGKEGERGGGKVVLGAYFTSLYPGLNFLAINLFYC